MALEKSLWQRVKKGGIDLRAVGHRLHMERLENVVGAGTPDVEGCLDGVQFWIELKSCSRPARPDTPIHPRKRDAQTDWLKARAAAGCKTCWVLIQVGEASTASLYLIPGDRADRITTPELVLRGMSVLTNPRVTPADVLVRAARG